MVLELRPTTLTKHYDWYKTAQYICTEAPHGWLFILYDGDEPIGLMGLSESVLVHMDCRCFADDLLFIVPEHRTSTNALFLIRSAVSLLQDALTETALLFVGNTVGGDAVSGLYRRAGFSAIGTNLVKELHPKEHK